MKFMMLAKIRNFVSLVACSCFQTCIRLATLERGTHPQQQQQQQQTCVCFKAVNDLMILWQVIKFDVLEISLQINVISMASKQASKAEGKQTLE